MAMTWYAVHTYSGWEKSVLRSLQDQIARAKMEDRFGQIVIPTESELERALESGPQGSSGRKFYPGYLLIQMELEEQTFNLVKNTPKITGFVGTGTLNSKPVPVRDPFARTTESS
jgi:transcriptional antiterminator NusG